MVNMNDINIKSFISEYIECPVPLKLNIVLDRIINIKQ